MAVKGRTIGEKCPACKRGRLEPILISITAGKTTSGIIGLSLSKTVIERLACNACSASYESDIRGKTPAQHVEEQLKDFSNPKREPKRCPRCAASAMKQGAHDTQPRLSHLPPLAYERSSELFVTRYLYCERCLHVAWVFPNKVKQMLEERARKERERLAQLEQFVNSGIKPDRCAKCGATDLAKGQEIGFGPSVLASFKELRPYLYCAPCNLVVWILPLEKESPSSL